mgnify:CR=1 FL=1
MFTIKGARNNVNLTQEQLAEKLGRGVNTIANWERGTSSPDVVDAFKLAEVCGLAITDIIWA